MAKAKKSTPLPAASRYVGDWGGDVQHIKLPSGSRLVMEDDDDCVLVFLGEKDITEKVEGATGRVVYNIFHDGRRLVNLPTSYAFQEMKQKFEENIFYYIHLDSEIETRRGLNPMKDFNVVRLGSEGETVRCPEKRTGVPQMTLDLETIADLNYNRLNYPLRRREEQRRAKRKA